MIIEFDSTVFQLFVESVQGMIAAFLPLVLAVCSVFIAFAILNSLSFFIKKAAK